LNINIFYDNVRYRLKDKKRVITFIEKVIRNKRRIPGDLFFIFTNDRKIRGINKEFLKHDYPTDIITFDNSEGKNISGEIYISIDTVKLNAIKYEVTIEDEVLRIIVHGILHLCGYDDKSEKDKSEMTKEENTNMLLY